MEIGEKIKYLRTKQGLSLEDLGKKVGVGKSTIRKWETGTIANMRQNKVKSLAKALNVSPLYLMDREENCKIDYGKDGNTTYFLKNKELIFEIITLLNDMNNHQLEDMKKYGEFLKCR